MQTENNFLKNPLQTLPEREDGWLMEAVWPAERTQGNVSP